jgi:pimeloyl-ACP methyl ester carboxylesterase
MEIRETAVVVDGVRAPVREAGPEDSEEAVVFVHGNPGSSRDWDDLLARTGTFARAVAPDMPGFGRADKPDGFEYTIQGYAHFLGDALDALGVRRAHLVLHDFGGPWGLAWAAAHPDAVGSVVLLNVGVLIGYRWHYLARIWRTPVLGELFQATTTMAGFRLVLRHGNPRRLPHDFVERMYRDLDRGTKRAVLRLYRATPAGLFEAPLPAMRELDPPTLVVWGRHDPYLPVRYAEAQRQAFPSAEVVVLDNSGHWPFADDPERVAELVVPFLRRQVDAAAPGDVSGSGRARRSGARDGAR